MQPSGKKPANRQGSPLNRSSKLEFFAFLQNRENTYFKIQDLLYIARFCIYNVEQHK
jgi:hypothetical protein